MSKLVGKIYRGWNQDLTACVEYVLHCITTEGLSIGLYSIQGAHRIFCRGGQKFL